MSTQILNDNNGNRIGEIETDTNGVQIARDNNRNKVGTYDPKFNATYDRNDQKIGEGNLLASLIYSPHNKWAWGAGGFLLGSMASERQGYIDSESVIEEELSKDSNKELIESLLGCLFMAGVGLIIIVFAKRQCNSDFSEHLGYQILYYVGWFLLTISILGSVYCALRLIVRFLLWPPVFAIWFFSAIIYMMYKIKVFSELWHWIRNVF